MSDKESPEYLEVPDYTKLTTEQAIDEEIEKHKANLVNKDILESRIRADKKAYVSSMNEHLKEIAEEREHEIDVIGALEQHKQAVLNGGVSHQ